MDSTYDEPQVGLSKRASGTLSKQQRVLTVGALEAALLSDFPADDAEAWDRTGLTVGDPASVAVRVAVALDATVSAVQAAAAAGANVLVTHHPAYLDPPSRFRPASSAATAGSGSVVWAAIKAGVSIMSFHTALDASPRAANMLPSALSLDWSGRVVMPGANARGGYGQLCTVSAHDAPLTLGALAARCTSVFAQVPRVWGDFDREISRVVTFTGSGSDVVEACLREGAECLVVGEIKYHAALDASEAGLSIIDIGHDTSELPYTSVLADACVRAGVPEDAIEIIDQRGRWSHPESTRL